MGTKRRIATDLIHAGEPRIMGAVGMPIFQSATFEYSGATDYHQLRYIRLNNTPNHLALHEKLAALENGEAALVAASGMAAISTTLLALLSAGDHLLAQDCLYGGTHALVTDEFPSLGLSSDAIDGERPETWKAKLRPKTKAIYVETMTNPLLGVAELDAVVTFAKEHGLISIIDNTFATPINYRPLEHGFDLSVHSATKYLNGHSDIVAGAVIGKKDLIGRVTKKLNLLGGTLDPHAAFLFHRGLKTLSVRVHHQNKSALEIARALAQHPAVARVNHPGLETHSGHARARSWFLGFGGMLSFELENPERVESFLARLELPIVAPSLGGAESLITLPAKTSHASLSSEARKKIGISDRLVRLSVGLEDTRDLIEDLERALSDHGP
jgi:cystathionine beta-lyase/cystathionine gamma-synthase